MLSSRLISLIEMHADSLARETTSDILTNQRTRSFQQVPNTELQMRIGQVYHNLGTWIADPNQAEVQKEYEEWGRTRFRQGIPLSEIVYCVILIKSHLRRFIREHGLVTYPGDRVSPHELLPLDLYGIQELNYIIGEFFDRALHHLAQGYEAAESTREGHPHTIKSAH